MKQRRVRNDTEFLGELSHVLFEQRRNLEIVEQYVERMRTATFLADESHPPGLTALDYLHLYWRKVDAEDRLHFLCEMLTPNERRALQFGLEDLEDSHDRR